MAAPAQTDLRIMQPTRDGSPVAKVTLAISNTGDLQVVDGREKLSEQLMRAIVNDDTLAAGIGINNPVVSTRQLTTLFTMILRNFRQAQVSSTQLVESTCIGFNVYRFDRYTSTPGFKKISDNPTTWKFVDTTSLVNGFTCTYGVTKVYASGMETSILEQIDVTPTTFADQQNPIVGKLFTAFPGSQSVTLFVDYNRTFKQSELLDTIQEISISEDSEEPRRYNVNILVGDLSGNMVSLSSQRVKPT